MFSFTSTGGRVDNQIKDHIFSYSKVRIIISWVVWSGTMTLLQNFVNLQYDTKDEVENKINTLGGSTENSEPYIVESLLAILNNHNKMSKHFAWQWIILNGFNLLHPKRLRLLLLVTIHIRVICKL